jgi:chromate reductase
MSKPRIGVFVGSLRKESYSRKIARELESYASDKMDFKEFELGDLELYNQDLDDENRPTASWIRFREQVKALDGVLFVTPEYNRSVPAVLKNALDVGSRPYGKSAWDGKPGAVVSVSPGGLSAFGANHHLRQSLVFLNVPTMQQPEVYIGNVAALLDEDGKVKEEKTRAFLSKAMEAFFSWVSLHAPAR